MIRVSGTNRLIFQGRTYPCAIGKGGFKTDTDKVEGDGATPIGCYRLRRVLYRADRLDHAPKCRLDIRPIQSDDGWCDDPKSPDYNQPVKLPFVPSHEELWRTDHIYDIIVILGHNDTPPVPGKGSAVFFHLARENYPPTEGCIAVSLPDMLDILKKISDDEMMEITG